eukprot:1428270-Lingulodinium_polyedra.AAC.1
MAAPGLNRTYAQINGNASVWGNPNSLALQGATLVNQGCRRWPPKCDRRGEKESNFAHASA